MNTTMRYRESTYSGARYTRTEKTLPKRPKTKAMSWLEASIIGPSIIYIYMEQIRVSK